MLISNSEHRTIPGRQIITLTGLHAITEQNLDQVYIPPAAESSNVGVILGIIFSVIIGLGCAGVCFWKRAVIMKRLKSLRGGPRRASYSSPAPARRADYTLRRSNRRRPGGTIFYCAWARHSAG